VHRSRTVNLAVVSALAASISGCFHEKKESVYCVNQSREVVENQRCTTETTAGNYYYWYGPAGTTYTRGQTVSGGSQVDASNKSANTSRGGFGALAGGAAVGGAVTKSSFSGGS
jgi:hypothetical protein